MSEENPVEVVFTSEFKRGLRRLAKRYRNVRRDVEPLIGALASGKTPGDRVPGVGAVVYKVRLPNPDTRRGTSGGYRVVYVLQSETRVVLLTIYSKSDQGDVSLAALRQIIEEASQPL